MDLASNYMMILWNRMDSFGMTYKHVNKENASVFANLNFPFFLNEGLITRCPDKRYVKVSWRYLNTRK